MLERNLATRMVSLLIIIFVISLLLTGGASAWFTRRLEVLSDLWRFSPGLLSLLGALGANIPNYVASLDAAISGQVGVGIGIIIGSNIYNIAIILCVVLFASPARSGLRLSSQEAEDAHLVGGITLAMMLTTGLAVGFFSWKVSASVSHQTTVLTGVALLACNLLTLGLFGLLSLHAFRRSSEPSVPAKRAAMQTGQAMQTPARNRSGVQVVGEMTLALSLALAGVIVMVQTGQAVASDIHLPPALLSLIILAIATSLPNTIVAFLLARTGRASASVEEIFSSNSVNAALGIGLPLLFWSGVQSDHLLMVLDAPLMVALTLIALFCVSKQHVSRLVGFLLLLIYIGWIIIHVVL